MPDEKKAAKTTEKASEQKKGTVLYVGPTIRKVIMAGSVFLDGRIPEAVKTAAKKCPAIMELLVPVKEGLKAQREVSKAGTAMNRYYEEAKKFRKE